jgi:multidrug transporter EmrE-like cation transporter
MIGLEVGWARALPYAVLSAVIISNVLGNIFMKLGSSVDASRAAIFGIFGWQTLVGISFFATGVLFYGWALKMLPLYVAQSVVVLQFVGAVLAAAVLFGELIHMRQWIGFAFIIVGLSLIINRLS